MPTLTLTEIVDIYLPENLRKCFFGDKHLFKIRRSKAGELSGGELRYMEIKLILWCDAPFILLDEPFNGLSPIAAKSVREQIRFASQTKGIILTDHNFREVHQCVNRIMLLHDCYLKEINKPEELIPYGYFEDPARM